MNRIFRVVRQGADGACAVVSERAASGAALAVGFGLALASLPAAADCTAGPAIVCSVAGGTQTTTVGAGPATPAGATAEVQAGAQVNTGDASGITLGDNAQIVVRSGATVQNFNVVVDSPYFTVGGNTIGGNTIEFNNNSVLRIEQGANVFANGTALDTEAINPVGTNNLIVNNGYVRSTNAAIHFQAGNALNTVVNNGVMEAGFASGVANPGLRSLLGFTGATAIDFTNRGSVIGSLEFGAPDDTLRLYTGSSITGNIRGGGGNNLLTLNSDDGGASTFAPLSLSGFQTLVNNGGSWTLNVPLPGSDITSTIVRGGTLILGADASSYTGSTSVESLGILQSTAQFAPRSIANAGLVRFAQPTSATYTGLVSGTGGIAKTGAGQLTLTQDQTFTGLTTITGGTLRLGNGGTQGSVAGDILDNAALVIDRSNTAFLRGRISGTGSLQQAGSGTTVLSGINSYAGATQVSAGVLRAGATGTFSPNSVHNVAAGSTLDLAGFSQTVAGVSNAGTVSLLGSQPGTVLVVNGPYVGNGGVLRIGTQLGDSDSPTDRLVLNGPTAVATGNTQIAVTNLGGLGALTKGNGIEVVSAINGASTAANAFSLAGGHVDAGAFEYRLYDGAANGTGESWYLRSSLLAGFVEQPIYRAEVPLFTALPAQLRQANLAMIGNLHLRVGDDEPRRAAGTGAGGMATAATAPSDRRAWGRVISTDLDIQQGGNVGAKSDGRINGFQAGTDLWWTPNWRAGVYVGQLEGDVSVAGNARGLRQLSVGRNDLRSRYLGLYGTWNDNNGFYADAVLQAGRHRYEVQPFATPQVTGKGNSLLASIEVGKAFAMGASGWQIEPQLQLVHQRLDLNDVNIVGALVRQDARSGFIARAGLRVKGDFATGAGVLQPYARFNVYRGSGGSDIASFVSPAAITNIGTPKGYTATELAGGATLALSQTTSLYGEIGKLWSSGGDTDIKSSVQGSLGVRVRW
ncbi:Outer membrane autotransporter barrel domain-containing protein [Burkholderiales bacterium 8X]|nr:Outer membrane autotransporter barrel domain-containing protein [Burkholderiales bacterium 8X]